MADNGTHQHIKVFLGLHRREAWWAVYFDEAGHHVTVGAEVRQCLAILRRLGHSTALIHEPSAQLIDCGFFKPPSDEEFGESAVVNSGLVEKRLHGFFLGP